MCGWVASRKIIYQAGHSGGVGVLSVSPIGFGRSHLKNGRCRSLHTSLVDYKMTFRKTEVFVCMIIDVCWPTNKKGGPIYFDDLFI